MTSPQSFLVGVQETRVPALPKILLRFNHDPNLHRLPEAHTCTSKIDIAWSRYSGGNEGLELLREDLIGIANNWAADPSAFQLA